MNSIPDLRRFGLFDARVPRFTSYPPATRFDGSVNATTCDDWLGQMPEGAAVSLYVHIPFCSRLCWFCACRTQGTSSGAPLAGYVETLLAEARLIRARMPGRIRTARLHLGGGTPTILSPDLMERLFRGLDDLFDLSAADEISAEIDPTECDAARLEVMARHGLSRASLGIQDFDPRVQSAIGRQQSPETTRDVIDMLRKMGIGSINLDLLYGLPFQTHDSLSRTLDRVIDMAPDRLALYGYAHVPWVAKRQVMIPTDALPSPEMRLALTQQAQARLLAEGFQPIGIDHFARPQDALARAADARRLARSFQGYTDDRTRWLIGMGASSISRYPAGYAQNEPKTGQYQALVKSGQLAVTRGCTLSRTDALVAQMVESLMCYRDIRLDDLTRDHEAAMALMRRLVDEFPACLDLQDNTLTIRDWALPLTRIIAASLGAAEPSAADRFSVAV